VHALVAPGKLEEDDASSIQPRLRVRTEDFVTAAVRTAIQANSTHRYTATSLGLIRDRDTGGVRDDVVDASIQGNGAGCA